IEPRIDLAEGLGLGYARSERSAPLLEDGLQPLAQDFALRSGLETEIADQATAIPFGVGQYAADDVQIAPQSLAGGEGLVVHGLSDRPLEVCEIAVQYLLGERLLGPEMIRERAVRSASGCADIAHGRPLVSRPEHHFEAGVENVFSERRLH